MTTATVTQIPLTLDDALDEADAAFEKALALYAADSEPEKPSFAIDSEEKALWAARKLRAAHTEVRRRNELAEQRIALIADWANAANEKPLGDIEFFTAVLKQYHERVLADDAKRKTVKLPGVTLAAKKKPDSWDFDDPTFLAWAEEHAPSLVRRPEAPPPAVDKNAAKKALTATGKGVVVTGDGEVVEGVVVKAGEVGFNVTVEDATDDIVA